jgi:hypothetical protein
MFQRFEHERRQREKADLTIGLFRVSMSVAAPGSHREAGDLLGEIRIDGFRQSA